MGNARILARAQFQETIPSSSDPPPSPESHKPRCGLHWAQASLPALCFTFTCCGCTPFSFMAAGARRDFLEAGGGNSLGDLGGSWISVVSVRPELSPKHTQGQGPKLQFRKHCPGTVASTSQ